MRAPALVLVLGFFGACGGNSQRQNGAAGSSGAQAASGGSGGDSVSMTGGSGGSSGTTASGGSSGTTASGGSSGTTASGGSGGDGATSGAPDASGATGGTTGGTGGRAGGSGATGGSAGTGGSGGEAGVPVPITSCTDDFPFLGTWDGTVLDFFFEPLEELKLRLFEEEGEIAGELTWGGESEPLPPVESADVPWPPGYWEQNAMIGFGIAAEPWPGFGYTVVRGAGCDSTFRFSVSSAEHWQAWCALQEPVYTDEYGWACTLQGGGSSDGETCTIQTNGMNQATYPLWKCSACGAFGGGGVCECDEAGCFASNEATHTFDLSHSLSGETEILSGADPSCADCTVRLERQP